MNRFQKYLVEEFAEDYQEGHLTRREALKMIAAITGSLLAANTILAACTPASPELSALVLATNISAISPGTAPTATTAPQPEAEVTATAEQSPEATTTEETPISQAGVEASDITIPAEGIQLIAYQARPGGEGSFPVVLVCHENRGLTEHIKDVTRRLANAGYVALAVDLLSRQGGTAALDSSDVPSHLGNSPPEQFVSDFLSGWHYLKEQSYALAERVGMVGFCFGGGVTWLMATRMSELLAAVPFYGPHPAVDEVPNIRAAVLAIYAGNDQRINQGIPPIEAAMQVNGLVYEKAIYPGTDHAFHNDTGSRYNPEAAMDAWERTLAWFQRYLSS